MTRRDYGTGTVRQRVDGSWEGRIDLGRDELGRRRRPTFLAGAKRDVQQAIAQALHERDAGIRIGDADRVTVAAFLARWLDESAQQRVRPRTLRGYRGMVAKYLVPAIGRLSLAKLSAAHIQQLVNARSAAGASPQTVRNLHAALRRSLNQAVRWGILTRNVASLVDLPRGTSYSAPTIDVPMARAIRGAVVGDRLESLVTVALGSGLRQGELLGLRWSDVDLDAGTLTVRHALQRGGGAQLVEPKTARSRRTIRLPAFALAALRDQRRRQLEDRLLAGSRWQEGGYVFTSLIGDAPVGC